MQIIFIILLALACLFLAVREIRLRRAMQILAESLADSTPTETREINAGIHSESVKQLGSTVLDTVAEATLERDSESEQRFFLEALLNEIKDCIFILDANEDIRFANKAAQQLFSTGGSLEGRFFLDACRDHRIYDTVLLAKEVGSKMSESVTLRFPRDDDPARIDPAQFLVEAEPLAIPGSIDHRPGSWVTLRDVTVELEAEQVRQDFVANASHELRTPLSIINGYLEIMMDEESELDTPMNRRAIQTMEKHGKRIARIVDEMLTISKLENAHEFLARETFNLIDPIESMISQLAPLIEQKHARIKLEAGDREDWPLIGDRFYWDQVFFNLIENALKQNDEPGIKISITLTDLGPRYQIEVSDDGIGIPAADLPLVFKRFYRVQKSHDQNKVKGTGLGLSIVKRAIEAHHGTISVDSHPGRRTTFTISLPKPTSAQLNPDSAEMKNGN
ncbi:MAG: ATP-binding protein [Verrucomicrobiota bacterium]